MPTLRRPPLYNFRGGGGGGWSFSTLLSGALKISNFITCLYSIICYNYLFHAESARNYLFQKYSSPAPPLEIERCPPKLKTICFCRPHISHQPFRRKAGL